MKALYVRRLFLWPRYQGSVKDSLENNECEVSLPDLCTYPAVLTHNHKVCKWIIHVTLRWRNELIFILPANQHFLYLLITYTHSSQ